MIGRQKRLVQLELISMNLRMPSEKRYVQCTCTSHAHTHIYMYMYMYCVLTSDIYKDPLTFVQICLIEKDDSQMDMERKAVEYLWP